MIVYDAIRTITGIEDIYQEIKQSCTEHFLSLYTEARNRIQAAHDPLYTALQFAAAGNAIDLGANPDFRMDTGLDTLLADFAVSDYAPFKKSLASAQTVLFCADNAGETVFDRLLIEQMDKRVYYAVRSKPIINDATLHDAQQAGVDHVAQLVESGCTLPGTVLSCCSPQFRQLFREVDLVISKGQGNYETLSHEQRSVFYLLKVKCPVVAQEIGARIGDLVFLKSKYED